MRGRESITVPGDDLDDRTEGAPDDRTRGALALRPPGPDAAGLPEEILHTLPPLGGIVQIAGEPWIGKTRLLSRLSSLARDKGYSVASGQAVQGRSGISLEPFVDALGRNLRRVPADLSALPARDLDLVDAILSGDVEEKAGPRTSGGAENTRRFAAMARLLDQLAKKSGLLVALDDFHRADDHSIELLAYLARNPPSAEVVIAVAYRSSLSGRRIDAIMERAGARPDRAAYVELRPLPADQIDALLPRGLSPVRRRRVVRDSAGNPGALRRLLSTDPEDAYSADDLVDGFPPLIVDGALPDLGALSPAARRVVAAAAISGDPFEPGIVRTVAQLPEDVVLAAIDELQDEDVIRPAHTIGRFRFRHPVGRAIAYHSAGAGWRYGATSRAARVLGARGASSTTLARHLEHLADDDAGARTVLLEGARESLSMRPVRARRWLSRVVEAAGQGSAEASFLLAKAHALLGMLPESLRLYAETQCRADAIPAELRADAAEWRVRAHRLMGRWDDARGLVEHGLRADPGSIPLGLESVALSIEAGEVALGPGARVPPAAVHAPDPALRAQALSIRALTHLARDDVADAAAAVAAATEIVDELQDDRLADRMETLRWLGEAELGLGRFGDAVVHLRRGLRFAIVHGQDCLLAHLSLALSRAYRELGDAGAAAAELDYAEDAAVRAGNGPVRDQVAKIRTGADSPGVAPEEAPEEAGRAGGEVLSLLSRRERQVADLVSLGATNQQIAHRLTLSQKTVETYLSRIFQKLDINSRAQIAHAVGRADRAC
ncbi:LuxR C-terminal-related transcriptional regulator [Actinomadura sp. 9N215]|uniref:LuxR C-terminal-related transcriptional regulator n=1 Tax=Actinomadura sp. 9N215 TaxID=3375150 RepID=UPI0037AC1318